MIDMTTDQPLTVETAEEAPPYMWVPVAQLETIKAVLDANKVSYWVDAEAMSIDGKPEVTVINFGWGTDPDTVQRLLDSVP